MKKNKKLLMLMMFLSAIILISLICAKTPAWPSFNSCCEKTKSDAWCQNAMQEDCDTSLDPITKMNFRVTPTSCDATSYCKLGCCVDTEEGLCMENSPQKVCQISTGTWLEDASCNVPQCRLGCCIIGDQASFVTLTRCKRISAIYGLKTNFRNEIINEATCIMTAYSQDKGACVYTTDEGKTCTFSTRQECTDSNATSSSNITGTEFFKDHLCSDDELATNCGPTTETTCIQGRDEVYFKDSCGNPGNIYDANRVYSKDPAYWKMIVAKSNTCGYKSSNANRNSKTCGNCNYIQGSICGNGRASYGNNICKDLNCYNTENGNNYRNGESWCVYEGETGLGQDLVGSRHFRHVCVQGEETIEPCADFRNEVCIEEQLSSQYGDFIEAACRVNRWQDCIDQFTEEDCGNTDKRDCYWVTGSHYDGSASGTNNNASTEKASTDTQNGSRGILNGGGICLPNVPPGLKFWNSGDAKAVCSLGNSKQIVTYNTNIWGTKSCKDNCEVLEQTWVNKINNVCTSLGDCGAKTNIAGKFTDDGVVWKSNGQRLVTEGILGNLKK